MAPIRLDAVTGEGGKIELTLPIPAGTTVNVIVHDPDDAIDPFTDEDVEWDEALQSRLDDADRDPILRACHVPAEAWRAVRKIRRTSGASMSGRRPHGRTRRQASARRVAAFFPGRRHQRRPHAASALTCARHACRLLALWPCGRSNTRQAWPPPSARCRPHLPTARAGSPGTPRAAPRGGLQRDARHQRFTNACWAIKAAVCLGWHGAPPRLAQAAAVDMHQRGPGRRVTR